MVVRIHKVNVKWSKEGEAKVIWELCYRERSAVCVRSQHYELFVPIVYGCESLVFLNKDKSNLIAGEINNFYIIGVIKEIRNKYN